MTRIQDWMSIGLRRPDLAWRKIRGLSPIEIEPAEAVRYLPANPTILEAGALNGLDTIRLATQWPGATIHTFEPVPDAFREVEERTRHLPNVHRYPLALAEADGAAEMHVSTDATGGYRPDSSSLLPPGETLKLMPEVTFAGTISVPTRTLDSWAAEHGLDRVDFMWLDMQGVELPVLQAAPRILATTTAVCMEVSRRELYQGCATYDEVLRWMRAQGFRVAIDRVSVWFGNVLFVRHQPLGVGN